MSTRSRNNAVATRAVELALDDPALVRRLALAFERAQAEIHAAEARDAIARQKAAGTYRGGLGPEVSTEAIDRRILEMRGQGLGIQSIALELQAAGVSAPRGPRWHKSTVRDVLKRAGRWDGPIGVNQNARGRR